MIKCTFENGSETNLRHVTADGIIIRGNEVLLNKRGSYNGKPILESGKWALIGGFVDRDETIAETFQREAMEEAGCKIRNIRLFRIKDYPNRPHEDRQNISFVLVADFVSMEEKKSEEVLELKWFDLNNLPKIEEMAFDHGNDLHMYKNYLLNMDISKMSERFSATIL